MIDLAPSGTFIALLSSELHDLKRAGQKRTVPAGEVIFEQGDAGDGLYVVEQGAVEITTMINGEQRCTLAVQEAGTFFGEMAVLDAQPRSATATAKVDSVVSFIPSSEVLRALGRSPELLALLVHEFSLRMRHSDRRLIHEIIQAERLTLIGRFAQSIIHDFKNPLNIITWGAELAAEEDVPAEQRLEAKNQICRQVARMTNMVNELLEFTRGTAREVVLRPANYREFVGTALADLIPEATAKSVRIVCEAPPPGLILEIDAERLQHVFSNLINNAIDMMPDGGAVTLRFTIREDEVVTEIEDTGPGLAPEIRAKLFQPFATHGKKHGTGLGLSICKRIIEDHRGSIYAHSEPRRGALFGFTLPRPQEKKESEGSASSTELEGKQ
jgi:signal transduction histidine kinase